MGAAAGASDAASHEHEGPRMEENDASMILELSDRWPHKERVAVPASPRCTSWSACSVA